MYRRLVALPVKTSFSDIIQVCIDVWFIQVAVIDNTNIYSLSTMCQLNIERTQILMQRDK